MVIISTKIAAQRFNISVRENASRETKYSCPGERPAWDSKLLSQGASLSLPSLIFQAGQHFSKRINPSVIMGSSTKREKASGLAWALISMINPYIEDDLLYSRPYLDRLEYRRNGERIRRVNDRVPVIRQKHPRGYGEAVLAPQAGQRNSQTLIIPGFQFGSGGQQLYGDEDVAVIEKWTA